MSFLTEYFDEYRQHPIKRTKQCSPENRWVKLKGKWLDPKKGSKDKEWTDEENAAFIKKTMQSLRGQSTYYNQFCAHHPPDLKYRVPKPRVKKLRPCAELLEAAKEVKPPPAEVEVPKFALKDTELMKMARDLYERDLEEPALKPLPTANRVLGYCRYIQWHTGLSDYQGGIARLAYETVRDDRIPKYYAHNGCRPKWGLPPEGQRQPELDGIPYDGERLY